MTTEADDAIVLLERRFLLDYPWDAARLVESLPETAAVESLVRQPTTVLVPVWRRLMPRVGAALAAQMPPERSADLLTELLPNEAARLLAIMEAADRDRLMGALAAPVAGEIDKLLEYSERSAGRLMNPAVATFRLTMTADQALEQLRRARLPRTHDLFLVDADNRLAGRIAIQELALADPATVLESLRRPVTAYVTPVATQEEVADLLERDHLADLPVVDLDGRLIGAIGHAALVDTMQADASADIQTMVGASRDERALSRPLFAVRKRLPWLQINLLTAFLAAAVVGLFESTIAQFTALAVLLPVVAGQSGNAGAQALAVTMRGLALREVSPRQWFAVTSKEVVVGLANGTAVAIVCGIGVFVWSGSFGLVFVIAASMVLAMVAAGFAGAVVPMVLQKLDQDPAQSSSIILTTVTDVAGFFSFLGIATLMMAFL